jgi:hypothetical protein
MRFTDQYGLRITDFPRFRFRAESGTTPGEGDHPEFRGRVRARVAELVAATQFSRGFVARIAGVVSSGFALRRALLELRPLGAAEGVPAGRVGALRHDRQSRPRTPRRRAAPTPATNR